MKHPGTPPLPDPERSAAPALVVQCFQNDCGRQGEESHPTTRPNDTRPKTISALPCTLQNPGVPCVYAYMAILFSRSVSVALMAWALLGVSRSWVQAEADQTGPSSSWTNSLGQVYVSVEGTSTRFCIWETRIRDYEVFVREGHWGMVFPPKPKFEQGPNHPVVNVSWLDAKDFCIWLTARERSLGLITTNQVYRLPTDREWSFAVGIMDETGETAEKRGNASVEMNYRGRQSRSSYRSNTISEGAWKTEGNTSGKSDGFVYTAPVGSFTPIENQLFDMNGNAWEWCIDFADDGRRHVLRGGSWRSPELRPPVRDFTLPAGMIGDVGFRCVLVNEVSWQ
ncbi:MAG: formylglycine-generating enzyme family protein [Limisphaerales bacterium]